MTNDRTTSKQISPNLPDSGLGDDLRSFLGDPSSTSTKPRTRNLRATFRPVPTGFPGTRAFSPRRADRGEAGAARPAARSRLDRAPAAAARADNPARRRAALQPAERPSPTSQQPAQPADAGSGGGRVRGRVGRKPDQAVAAGGVPGRGKAAKDKPVKASGADDADALDSTQLADKSAPKYVPTETERARATNLFREIGERFNQNRKKSKASAYAAYRHDLMANLDTLIMGGAIDLKEVTTVVTNLEQYTKETEAESTETPATILGRWLRMEPGEVAELEKGAIVEEEVVEEEVEDEEIVEEEPVE